jgi:tetratricopeptide (TPR) repeat protein
MDFSQLKRPAHNSKPLDPISIFERRPSLQNTPNDLWRGQTEALREWHQNRKKTDVFIALNTGAGKTLVGLLVAQSLVNEGVENVTYVCGTRDLVFQTHREAIKLGIECTLRTSGHFSNPFFETGKTFCITTYSSLFNGLSFLQRNYFPGAVIFDDAHVAERMIRESFTLKIAAPRQTKLLQEITSLLKPHFQKDGKLPSLESAIDSPFEHPIMASPSAVKEISGRLYRLLVDSDLKNDADLKYSFNLLKENLEHCAVVFGYGAVEIAPPFLPLFSLPIFLRNVRRIYLSASLNYKSDIARAFGRIPDICIEPKNDAGNGERLILFADEVSNSRIDSRFVSYLSKKHKVLITVPSYRQAEVWKEVGNPPSVEEFSNDLQRFREAPSGTFILVSRVDGIDLPHDTCRVMIFDELPTGSSILEKFQWDTLDMKNFRSAKVSNQIIQLFGRINRGRNDYGAFIINGHGLSSWLKNDRKLALLPELLRKQVRLGLYLHEQQKLSDTSQLVEVIDSVLSRNSSWIDFYGESINEMDLDDESSERTQEIEEQMTQAALAEVQFMSAVWDRDYATARQYLEAVIEKTARADEKLSGWHNLWLGMCLESENDYEAAQEEYLRAYQRLAKKVIVPRNIDGNSYGAAMNTAVLTDFEQQIDLIVKRKSQESYQKTWNRLCHSVAGLDDSSASIPQQEEALRALGEYLGFTSTRPDNDDGTGPDVFWVEESTNKCLAFELKTGKKENPVYYKKDVEQGHDHLEWIRQNYQNYFGLGLVYVGSYGKRDKAANPSSEMYLCDLSILVTIKNKLLAGIEDLRKVSPNQRRSKVVEFCSEGQWKLEGLASKVKVKSMQSLEMSS